MPSEAVFHYVLAPNCQLAWSPPRPLPDPPPPQTQTQTLRKSRVWVFLQSLLFRRVGSTPPTLRKSRVGSTPPTLRKSRVESTPPTLRKSRVGSTGEGGKIARMLSEALHFQSALSVSQLGSVYGEKNGNRCNFPSQQATQTQRPSLFSRSSSFAKFAFCISTWVRLW